MVIQGLNPKDKHTIMTIEMNRTYTNENKTKDGDDGIDANRSK